MNILFLSLLNKSSNKPFCGGGPLFQQLLPQTDTASKSTFFINRSSGTSNWPTCCDIDAFDNSW